MFTALVESSNLHAVLIYNAAPWKVPLPICPDPLLFVRPIIREGVTASRETLTVCIELSYKERIIMDNRGHCPGCPCPGKFQLVSRLLSNQVAGLLVEHNLCTCHHLYSYSIYINHKTSHELN